MKTKTIFVCQSCGATSPKWVGKCPSCESWNSYAEEPVLVHPPSEKLRTQMAMSLAHAPVLLKEVSLAQEKRFLTGMGEFDRVVGGGLVPSSVTLIGGDPGIGKSTIVLQVACTLARAGLKVLYVSGEESVKQVKMRADRLNQAMNENLFIVNDVDVQSIIGHIHEISPRVVIIDSIQVVFLAEITAAPGSVSQVRESAAVFTQLAKQKGMVLLIIGHVTKEGAIAGPRVLEHMVDTVLYFEGERYSSYRVLRTNKNRFGSTNEIGVFEMTSDGLQPVSNPSQIFLSERAGNTCGSAVVPILEGTRPLLVEIQGLVARSMFGMVRQKAQGFDQNRLALLAAVLEKRLGFNLTDKDLFLNVVGGVKIIDPAADLGVALSIASALLDKPIPADTVILGEVGLSAEVRSVAQPLGRIHEAEKLGFSRCLLPANNLKNKIDKPKSIQLIAVATLKEAWDKL